MSSKLALPFGAGMMDHLIWIGRAAVDDRTIAVRLELFGWSVFCGAQRREKFLFIPGSEQHVIAPVGVRVFDSVLRKLSSLFDGGCAGHVAEAARMRTADRNVKSPVGKAFVNKVILSDDGGSVPETDLLISWLVKVGLQSTGSGDGNLV